MYDIVSWRTCPDTMSGYDVVRILTYVCQDTMSYVRIQCRTSGYDVVRQDTISYVRIHMWYCICEYRIRCRIRHRRCNIVCDIVYDMCHYRIRYRIRCVLHRIRHRDLTYDIVEKYRHRIRCYPILANRTYDIVYDVTYDVVRKTYDVVRQNVRWGQKRTTS